MKTLAKAGFVVLALGGAVAVSYSPISDWWRKRNLPTWREDKVVLGTIVSVVNSTGTVEPVMSVQIGAFVSGPIDPRTKLVEFNQEVEAGDVLAIIDQRIFKADVDRDLAAVQASEASLEAARSAVESARAAVSASRATLKTRQAEAERTKAQVKQAENDEIRAKALAAENRDFISQAELDNVKFNRMQLREAVNVAMAAIDQARAAILQTEAKVSEATASWKRAKAGVSQAKANLTKSELNKGYATITSPVDGIVIDRKIEPGQTLASTFQTPELFVVAPGMRDEMHVKVSVDEADIGMIRKAQQFGNIVEFTIDAYPDDLFQGRIKEVRFSSTKTENVVTYPVIVAAANPDLKLLPGMTASISFRIEEKRDVLKIPNAALRFYPPRHQVRNEDQRVLDGTSSANESDIDNTSRLSAAEKSDAEKKRKRRHVWVVDGAKLRAIEVVVGISDSKFTEVVSGELTAELKLVTGVKPKKTDE
jgi:HlyD family secretion protein